MFQFVTNDNWDFSGFITKKFCSEISVTLARIFFSLIVSFPEEVGGAFGEIHSSFFSTATC